MSGPRNWVVAMIQQSVDSRTFLPGQVRFLEDAHDEVLYSGAFGSGKTRALCEKALMLSMMYPGNRGLLCRKQLMAVKATTLVTLLEGDGSMPPVIPPEYIARHNRVERIVTLQNGSEIMYGGVGRAEDVNWIKSLNLGWVGVDQLEELSFADWILLLGRLRLDVPSVRQAFGVCNPAHQGHWLYRRFFSHPEPGTSVIGSNTLENIYLPPDYLRRLSNFRGVQRERYVLGKWVSFEGAVYPYFSPATHVVDSFPIPDHWTRFGAIDFGFVSPFVFQWWAVADADYEGYFEGSMFLCREWYMTKWIVKRHAEQILLLNEGDWLDFIVADHDAENVADLEDEGILTESAEKSIKSGIQAVTQRLGNYYVDETTGKIIDDQNEGIYVPPTMFFFRDALVEEDIALQYDAEGKPTGIPLSTIEEIPGYIWKQVRGETKEQPVDKNNHGCDAMRYAVMAIRYGGHHGLYV